MFRLLLVLLLVPLSGCAAPLAVGMVPLGLDAARVGSAAYTSGELRVARKASLEELWQATHEALEELELDIRVERVGERRRYVMARDTDDERAAGPEIRLQFDRRSPVLTRLSIRVGLMGDRAVSELLMREIDRRLLARHTEVND